MVWDEAQLVVDRVNNLVASEAVLIQMAILSAFSKDGQKAFKKAVEELSSE